MNAGEKLQVFKNSTKKVHELNSRPTKFYFFVQRRFIKDVHKHIHTYVQNGYSRNENVEMDVW